MAKVYSDKQRTAIKEAMTDVVHHVQQMWLSENDLERAIGFDVDGLSEYFLEIAIADNPNFDDGDIDNFLEWANAHRDGDPEEEED